MSHNRQKVGLMRAKALFPSDRSAATVIIYGLAGVNVSLVVQFIIALAAQHVLN
ncbi:MAG: hypothetical protein WAL80_03440 [Xanthobacteraceae bacterium]|jgi:hypothetical protein